MAKNYRAPFDFIPPSIDRAWKCDFPTFKTIMTNRRIKHQPKWTDMWGHSKETIQLYTDETECELENCEN